MTRRVRAFLFLGCAALALLYLPSATLVIAEGVEGPYPHVAPRSDAAPADLALETGPTVERAREEAPPALLSVHVEGTQRGM